MGLCFIPSQSPIDQFINTCLVMGAAHVLEHDHAPVDIADNLYSGSSGGSSGLAN